MSWHANFVFGLNQATRIVPGRYVTEMYIVGQATEERNAIADQHWNTRDNKVLNKPRSEKALNGYPAIYVCMPYPPSLEPRNNFDRFTRQMLYYRTSWGWSK